VGAFGCFSFPILLKKGKENFCKKISKKSPDLFDQFVSMAEREIDII